MTELDRRLGLIGATAVGVGSMIGAGLFVALPPAVAASGRQVWVALAVAGLVAVCNAWSSSRLAAVHPRSGGTYVYATEQLGRPWGVLAGGAFVVGKTASLAVMAGAIGRYAVPEHATAAALGALALVTAINLAGVQRSAAVMIGVVAVVLAVVAITCVRLLTGPSAGGSLPDAGAPDVLAGAGLLFFAFAGFARLATLGGEVQRPEITIPRAVGVAVAIVAVVYAASLAALVHALGPSLADTEAPFAEALDGPLVGVVTVVAVVSAAGALLSLGLGVSRTTFAMADDGVLPRGLARVAARTRVPWVAEIVTAFAAAVLLLTVDLTRSLTASSVLVLVYYAIANASAWTLGGVATRFAAAIGLVGCSTLVVALLV